MNWLDFVLAALLLFSVVTSARKGFSREIIGLAAAFAGLILGMWFYGLAGSLIAPYMSSTRAANLIGFLLVLFAVLLSGGILGSIVNRFLRTIGLSFFDRLLGALFGLGRGFLIATAFLMAFMAFSPWFESPVASRAVMHSRIAPSILETSRLLVAVAPMELKTAFHKQYTDVKAALLKSQVTQ